MIIKSIFNKIKNIFKPHKKKEEKKYVKQTKTNITMYKPNMVDTVKIPVIVEEEMTEKEVKVEKVKKAVKVTTKVLFTVGIIGMMVDPLFNPMSKVLIEVTNIIAGMLLI